MPARVHQLRPEHPAMTLGEAVTDWLSRDEVGHRAFSPATKREYKKVAARLSNAVGGDRRPLATITHEDVARLLTSWEGVGPATYTMRRSALSSLFRFAVSEGWVADNPVARQATRRPAERTPDTARSKTLSDDEVLLLVGDRSPLPWHYRAIVAFQYDTACRAEEALSLDLSPSRLDCPPPTRDWTPRYLDAVRREAHVLGKGGRPETLRYPRYGLFSRYVRALTADREHGPLFLTARPLGGERLDGRDPYDRDPREPSGRCRISYSSYAAALKKAGPLIGRPDLTSHMLRHTALSRLADNGVGLAHIQAVSRHRSWKTLAIYLHPSETAVRDLVEANALRATRPRGR